MLLGVTQKMGFEVEEEVILVNLSKIMEMMKGITEGKLITIVETCKRIAKKHKVKRLLQSHHWNLYYHHCQCS